MSEQDPSTGRFLPGNSGFGGRPKGARNKLGEQFIADLQSDWETNGKDAIRTCRELDAATYCKIVASLLPKEHLHKVHDPLDDLSDDDVSVGLAAIRAARAAGAVVSTQPAQAGSKKTPNPVH